MYSLVKTEHETVRILRNANAAKKGRLDCFSFVVQARQRELDIPGVPSRKKRKAQASEAALKRQRAAQAEAERQHAQEAAQAMAQGQKR